MTYERMFKALVLTCIHSKEHFAKMYEADGDLKWKIVSDTLNSIVNVAFTMENQKQESERTKKSEETA